VRSGHLRASGDLTERKLLPALERLASYGGLPPEVALIGVARTAMTDAEFGNYCGKRLPARVPEVAIEFHRPPQLSPDAYERAIWNEDPRPIPLYQAATWGPPEAGVLTARDGRKWRHST
jgi:glucose-6-phosphate 1-dehydrogenase